MKIIPWLLLTALALFSCKNEETVTPVNAYIETTTINGKSIGVGSTTYDVSTDSLVIGIRFSSIIKSSQWNPDMLRLSGNTNLDIQLLESADPQTLRFRINNSLSKFTSYNLTLFSGLNLGIKLIDTYYWNFKTEMDTTPKFPIISDNELLTLVQHRTFDYFWKYGHPVSGLARERLGSGETVTMGGSGFGLMALLTGIERSFITRAQGFGRLDTIVNFLSLTSTDKFHGVFPHWMNGITGKIQPFSTNDDGADLVETAFLFQGLLTVQAYFKNGNTSEKDLCQKIQTLWENVEWTWFQQNGQEKLFWHWSPDKGWVMNMPVSGWNEGLIIYVLAASSPTHPITKSVYTNGWAANGNIRNGNSYYGITLPLGEAKGGPLFSPTTASSDWILAISPTPTPIISRKTRHMPASIMPTALPIPRGITAIVPVAGVLPPVTSPTVTQLPHQTTMSVSSLQQPRFLLSPIHPLKVWLRSATFTTHWGTKSGERMASRMPSA